MTLKHKYHVQKINAKARGIEWQFTYDTWVDWWGKDITNRGRTVGKLVMARHNDTGPYHPGNVSKLTNSKNTQDALLGKSKSDKHSEHIRQAVKIIWTNEEYKKQRVEASRQKTINKYKNMSDEEFATWTKRFDGKSGCALSNLKNAQRIRAA